MQEERLSAKIDWVTIVIYTLLVISGWLNIYAADYDLEASTTIFSLNENSGKQLLWMASAVVIIGAILFTDSKFFETFSWGIYGTLIFLLIMVLFFGKEIAGSRSWFELGSFRLQPSEFAKFATVIALSKFLSAKKELKEAKTLLLAITIFSIPALLILLQGDAGTALVFGSLVIVLFKEGMNPWFVIAPILFVLLFLLTLLVDKTVLIITIIVISTLSVGLSVRSIKQVAIIVTTSAVFMGTIFSVDYVLNDLLKPHQQRRIQLLVNPDIDPLGAGWNVTQSKIAIGSGGLVGKGFLQGTQTKFDFVPEQSTDFIFCTVGEEHGWAGTSIIITLYVVLLLRILALADRQKSAFARVYGYGVCSILFFHILINISMTVGLFPVAGIPLPFLSYGGSSLWSFTILLFVMLKIDSKRLDVLQR